MHIFEYVKTLQHEVLNQDDQYNEFCNSGKLPIQQRKADRERDEKLREIVKNQEEMGNMDYLRGIANNTPDTGLDFHENCRNDDSEGSEENRLQGSQPKLDSPFDPDSWKPRYFLYWTK